MHNGLTFDSIIGQTQAKRALTIAIAGRHNILLYGPPGTGKTSLARTIPGLLPNMTTQEKIELAQIQSLVVKNTETDYKRPFRAPHHSASLTSIIGGGSNLRPGEISLAHNGVLFLDELPEFQRNVLEALRQPLEAHTITIARANYSTTFPANFILCATMNPCPCGFLGSDQHTCTCSPIQISNYRKKLSGPLLDRIDIRICMPSTNASVCVKNTTASTNEYEIAKNAIRTARLRQNARFGVGTKYNSELTVGDITMQTIISTDAHKILELAAQKLHLSTRSYFKIIKVAQTIADIESSDTVQAAHISEALQYHKTP